MKKMNLQIGYVQCIVEVWAEEIRGILRGNKIENLKEKVSDLGTRSSKFRLPISK
ncbi:hypothetical protein Hanom_Chr02g00163521 [Helianthus anomalus]